MGHSRGGVGDIGPSERRIVSNVSGPIEERALNASVSFGYHVRLKTRAKGGSLVRCRKNVAVIGATDDDVAIDQPVERLQSIIPRRWPRISITRTRVSQRHYFGIENLSAGRCRALLGKG